MASSLGLGPFVLVMGERQVGAATVQVEAVAQDVQCHGNTFDVPAGAAVAPWGGPGWFTWFGRLPQSEVEGVLLAFVDLDSGASSFAEILGRAMYEFAVAVFEAGDAEVDTLAVDHIGVFTVDQLLDDVLHLIDVFGGVGTVLRMDNVQSVHLIDVGLGVGLGDRCLSCAFGRGPLDDLVIDVGDIGHHRDFEASPPKETSDYVVGQRRTSVAKVGHVVHRWSAGVDRHLARFAWRELDHFVGEGVEVLHGQRG